MNILKNIKVAAALIISTTIFNAPSHALALTNPSADLNITSYNVQLWPFYGDESNPPNHKDIRVVEIPKALGTTNDVIVFQEVFDSSLRSNLINQMRPNYPFYMDAANNIPVNPFKPDTWTALTSGVVVFSKYPIITSGEYKFSNCHKEDCLAAKGVRFVKINKNGIVFNLLGTHLQATNDNSAWQSRSGQVTEIKNYIQSLNIPANEPIIVTGDFNINLPGDPSDVHVYDQNVGPESEWSYTLRTLNAQDLALSGDYQYSFDYALNSMTALSSSNKGFRQALDHVIFIKGHLLPNLNTSKEFYSRPLSTNPDMKNTADLSDHFPVSAQINF